MIALLACGGLGYTGWTLVNRANHSSTPSVFDASGTERLGAVKSGTEGDLTFTVTSVRVFAAQTVVSVTAKNTGPDNLTVPIWENCSLIDNDHESHAGSMGSEFPDIPAGQTVNGTMTFNGAVAPTATSLDLACADIFDSASLSGIQVNDIALK